MLSDYEIPNLDWQSLNTIVDVGANVGVATVWFAARAPHAQILAVEPSPIALSVLESNIDMNGLGARVRVVPIALGRNSGVGYLRAPRSSVQTQVTMVSARNTVADHPVSVTTLEALMRDWQLGSIDLLKLDCEGAEYDILLSLDETILGRVLTIIGEYHEVDNHEPGELKSHLELHGFEVALQPHPRDPTLGRFTARKARGRVAIDGAPDE